MKRRGVRNQVKFVGFIMMIIYLIFVSYFGFFSKIAGRTLPHINEYNLIPFRTIINYVNSQQSAPTISFVVNIIGNVAVFIPFGIILPLIFHVRNHKFKIYWVLVWALLLSLAIELIQYLLSVGVFDVDDLILNTVGALVGYYVYLIIKTKYNRVI